MKSRTKDELFIIRTYETALKLGNVYAEVDRYAVGKSCHLSTKAVDTICNLLAQANFIKKQGSIEIYLTSNGEQLAISLLT